MEDENPIPSHDPRRAIGLVAGIGVLLLALMIGLIISLNKPKSDRPGSVSRSSAQVDITKDGFVPATIKVPRGATVTWTNKDDQPHHVASNPHPEHNGKEGLDSKDVIGIEGGTYSYTFDEKGEFTYHDHLNPTMNGTVVVE